MNPIDCLQVAEEAALAAGAVAREKFHQSLQVTSKGFRDLVTDADFAAQEAVTSVIRKAFPDYGFLTEEEDGSLPDDGPVIWIIDPIDGTTNYSKRIPVFCVSIAAVRNNPPLDDNDLLAGVIYDPMRDEMFSTSAGSGSLLNGRMMHVSGTDELAPAVVAADWNRIDSIRQTTLETVNNLVHHVDGIRSFASAALALAWVSAGRIDGYFNYSLMAWDTAAASLLIRNAGGNLTDAAGQPLSYGKESMTCLASNGRLHKTLLNYMPKNEFQ